MTKTKLPFAKYIGEVDLNGFKISCAVLEDGRRIFSERSLANAFGIKGGGTYWQKKKELGESAILPEYLSAKYLMPFISNDLINKFEGAILYVSKSKSTSRGVEVTILPDICDVYITAKNNGIDNDKFLKVATNAYTMMKAFAKVGIIALVDEATGYQYDREQNELQTILKLFISDEILTWQQAFHLNFYKEIFRLWNIPFTDNNIRRKPLFIGKLTKELVYKNLPKGTFVLEKLKEKTPKTTGGNFRYRLHQSLTQDIGREALKKVIYSIETLAAISESKEQFRRFVEDRYGQREIHFTEFWDIVETSKIENPTNFDKQLIGLLNVSPDKKY
jgi:hypothetical protein